MKLGKQIGLGPGNIVLDGNPAPLLQTGFGSPKRDSQFSAHVYCSQTAACIKMLLGTEVGLGPDDIVLDGDPAPLPKKGMEPPPQFSAHVYCDQTAGWMKMALGMDVGLGPGHIVLDGDPAFSPNWGGVPIFRTTSIVAKRLHGSRCHFIQR